jgi:hypothetical protein
MIPQKAKPKKIYKVQVHIIHSMIHMVKNKLKHEKWMEPRDFVEANTYVFEKMGASLRHTYELVYSPNYSWEAAELYLAGLQDEG